MTEEQRDNLLLEMKEDNKKRDKMFEEMRTEMKQERETREKQYKEMKEDNKKRDALLLEMKEDGKNRDKIILEIRETLKTEIKTREAQYEEIFGELTRQRKNTARMEHNLIEKISALFDQREITIEKFTEQDSINKDVQSTLEHYNSRIFRLERMNNIK